MCYGQHSKAVIGGTNQVTDIDLDCPTCTQAQLCPEGTDLCFRLSTGHLHVFQGSALQSLLQLPTGCLPLRITEHDPGYEYIIQCVAESPLYTPMEVHAYRDELADDFVIETELSKIVLETGNHELVFSPIPNNCLRVVGVEIFSITLLQDSRLLVQSYDNFEYFVDVTDCSTVHSFISGPFFYENIQLVVDCNNTDGMHIRIHVLIPNTLQSEPTFEVMPNPLPGDIVSFSPKGTYIVYRGTSTLSLIPAAQLTVTSGNLHFSEGPIAQIIFLTENELLVSIPGENRILVDIQQFFASGFESGHSDLLDSIALCSQGDCPPVVISNKTFYLFSADPENPSYQVLAAYNVSNPSASPDRISRLLRTAKYKTCFPVRATITGINTSPEPPSSPPTPPPTSPPSLSSNTSPIGGLEYSEKPKLALDANTIAGIVVGLVILTVIVIVICVFVLICLCLPDNLRFLKKIKPKNDGGGIQETENPLNFAYGMSNSLPSSAKSSQANILTQQDAQSFIQPIPPTHTRSQELFPAAKQETVVNHKPVPRASHQTEQQAP